MSRIRVADIIAAASRMTGIPVADITGRSRVQRLARVRQAIAYVAAKQDDRMSYPQIGRILGRDHSTILHSIGMAEIFRKRDPEYAKFLRQLRMEARNAGHFAAGPVVKVAPAPVIPKPPAPKPVARSVKAKNDFRPDDGEGDNGHKFQAGISRGSNDFLAKLNAARAA